MRARGPLAGESAIAGFFSGLIVAAALGIVAAYSIAQSTICGGSP